MSTMRNFVIRSIQLASATDPAHPRMPRQKVSAEFQVVDQAEEPHEMYGSVDIYVSKLPQLPPDELVKWVQRTLHEATTEKPTPSAE